MNKVLIRGSFDYNIFTSELHPFLTSLESVKTFIDYGTAFLMLTASDHITSDRNSILEIANEWIKSNWVSFKEMNFMLFQKGTKV